MVGVSFYMLIQQTFIPLLLCSAASPVPTSNTKTLYLQSDVETRRISQPPAAHRLINGAKQRVYFYLSPWRRVYGNGCGDRRWCFISSRLTMTTVVDTPLRCIIPLLNLLSLSFSPSRHRSRLQEPRQRGRGSL